MSFYGAVNISSGNPPENAIVSATSSVIIPANVNRNWCMLTNIGNRDVFVALGQTAEINKGIFLGRQGGAISLGANIMSVEVINGITDGGSAIIIYQEGE